jgi:hypothetical protein
MVGVVRPTLLLADLDQLHQFLNFLELFQLRTRADLIRFGVGNDLTEFENNRVPVTATIHPTLILVVNLRVTRLRDHLFTLLLLTKFPCQFRQELSNHVAILHETGEQSTTNFTWW